MRDLHEQKKCPECSMQWEKFVDCYVCQGTGLLENGAPCNGHTCCKKDARVKEGDFWKNQECNSHCCHDGKRGPFYEIVGVQYDYTCPEAFDGVSEWMCPGCGTRWGRFSGKKLAEDELEKRDARNCV